MSFVSLEFAVFAALVVPLYFLTPGRARWAFLLAASYVFYAYSNPGALVALIALTLADYVLARAIARADKLRRKRSYLLLSIALNIGVLFVFKYFTFVSGALGTSYVLNIALPLGISFYTFVKLGYVIDVYRGKYPPETHAGIFAAFVAFFPTVSSGPIERGSNMLPQFRQTFAFDERRVVEGLRLILWGAFKKLVIADRLAIYVNTVYNQPQDHDGPVLLVATLFLAFQIYADFSGYTDMAVGMARLLGFKVMDNFRQPYFARSVLDFWRRWHISLSTWIREYLFFPLSRLLLQRTERRFPRLVEVIAYLIVMLLVGLWHGAAWTFVVWGGLHGVYMAVETVFNARKIRVLPARLHPTAAGALKMAFTFALVGFAWIFFRANSLPDAGYIITHLFDFSGGVGGFANPFAGTILAPRTEFALSCALIALLIGVDALDARWPIMQALAKSPAIVRWGFYYAAGAAILFSGLYAAGAQQFIYFQF